MRWASPSTIAVLPTPASPISTGLFLPRRERTSMVCSISSSRPITGSIRPCRASSVRSRPYLSRVGRAGRRGRVAAAPGPAGGVRRLGRQAGGAEPGRVQDVPGRRVRVRGERAQHVLGADVAGPARPARGRARPAGRAWRPGSATSEVGGGASPGGAGPGPSARRSATPARRGRRPARLSRLRVGSPAGAARSRCSVSRSRLPCSAAYCAAPRDQLPGGLAQQPPDVDLPGAGTRARRRSGPGTRRRGR